LAPVFVNGDASPFFPSNQALAILQALTDPTLGPVGSADPVRSSGGRDDAFEIVGSFLVREVSIGELKSIIQNLNVTDGAKNSLLGTIRVAQRMIDAGRTNAAKILLRTFVVQVQIFVRLGRIDPDTASSLLIRIAKAIIGRM
jgi:hypothetical protein